jgi:molecular chaperone DnaK
VVRRSQAGTFELLNSAESVEPNGGDSFDDVIFEHVRAVVAVDMADPHAWTTLTRLRQLCTRAKESLSTASETTVREIQVSRTEFEDLIRPAVEAGVEELLRTIRAASEDISSVVITGGSAAIPLVGDLLTAQLRNRTVVAPELACARGAAIAAQSLVPAREATPVQVQDPDPDVPPPERPEVDVVPLDLPRTTSFLRKLTGMNRGLLGAAAAVVLAGAVALTVYLKPDTPAPAGVTSVTQIHASAPTSPQEGGR